MSDAKNVQGLSFDQMSSEMDELEAQGDRDRGVYDLTDFHSGADHKATPASPPSIKGLDLSRAMRSRENESVMVGAGHVQEEEISVVFELPDGSQGENTFKLGHTVEFLKSFVESEYGIPMGEQNLYLEDALMMDPLSLNDFPAGTSGGEMWVRVDGYLPAESKK